MSSLPRSTSSEGYAMDCSLYKDFKISRGFTYHYYYRPTFNSDKPTLVLLHGFPSTSADWAGVAEFFWKEGYGVLVPDLLGYGGTDKPTDPHAYRLKKMAKDVVEILDSEKLNRVVVVSHDWGSGLNSRLIVYFPERILAAAFFAVGYTPPSANFDVDVVNAQSVEKNGYAKFGYWKFFSKDGADKITLDHIDSFFSLLYSNDKRMLENWCPEGALERWLRADQKLSNTIISEEEKRSYIEIFSKNGFAGPFCWYKAMVHKVNNADSADIPKSAFIIKQPVFFGGCSRDPTSPPSEFVGILKALCPNHTVKVFKSGHWVLHERPSEVNQELREWLDGIALHSEGIQKSNL